MARISMRSSNLPVMKTGSVADHFAPVGFICLCGNPYWPSGTGTGYGHTGQNPGGFASGVWGRDGQCPFHV